MSNVTPCTYELARREFPDYANELFPAAIPEGFTDSSWRNDTCPSVSAEFGESRLRIWFEMEAPESREYEGAARYTVTFEYMPAGVDSVTMLETEDWGDVLALFANSDFAAAIARPIANHGDAALFIRALIKHNALFHFEDSPESIFWGAPGCAVKPEHFPALSARVRESYALTWRGGECPIGLALDMTVAAA